MKNVFLSFTRTYTKSLHFAQKNSNQKTFFTKDFLKLKQMVIDQTKKIFTEEEISNFLQTNEITVTPSNVKFLPMLTFASTDFSKEMLKLLSVFEFPTPIQSQSWPIISKKHNLVSIAKTGSGKSLSFILPAITYVRTQKLSKSPIV
jgi:superfamily II DNA/RNA helicase